MKQTKRMRGNFRTYLQKSLGNPQLVSPESFSLAQLIMEGEERIKKARESQKERAAVWKERAAYWEKILVPQLFAKQFEFIHNYGRIQESDNITSIGSDLGVLENFIAKEMSPKGRFTCIDFVHEMNMKARQRKEHLQVKNISFVTAEADKIPLKSATQEKVICIGTVLPVFPEWDGMLNEARRIIKNGPNSRLILTVNVSGEKFIDDALSSIRRHGFVIEKSEIFSVPMAFANIMIVARPK